eukprot:Protomagalhaensia_sp_Gyna_25__5188@NODE_61_length_5787_cov_21_667015_g45_i0_p1_GENE_NODE_61_length_5787_cov_21_667015_g45_i0NODE_61_length_5787_cov_21_667015_g45_i0_p1_ORF_typecomplete_len671_score98_81dsRBD2/PF17842_1/0_21_NODE_61_length_5787_cov_21_667015_g45_i06362648
MEEDAWRGPARKRLLSELLLESEWLMKRVRASSSNSSTSRPTCTETNANPTASTTTTTNAPAPLLFPSASAFFGCASTIVSKTEDPIIAAETKPTLWAKAGPACILAALPAKRPRLRLQWASLCRSLPHFGDPEDRVLNPSLAATESLQWVLEPFRRTAPLTAILTGTHKEATARLLGDAAPLSPVVQPCPFFQRRNRRRTCAIHRSFETIGSEVQARSPPEAKAYHAAWDRQEPLSLPPTCSCAQAEAVIAWIRKISETLSSPAASSSESTEVTPETATISSLMTEAENLLASGGFCSTCSGLQYHPFSFIEVPLSHECQTLVDFCERVPLPPKTQVFCDGPKITVCVVCRSPQHEWQAWKALFSAGEHRHAAIYDVCSAHYFPGYRATKLYWTRGLVKKAETPLATQPPSVVREETVMREEAAPPEPPEAPVETALSPSLAVPGQSPASIHSPRSLEPEAMSLEAPEPDVLEAGDSPLQRAWRALAVPFESPLKPPPALPLNMARIQPHPLFVATGQPALTTPDLRRIYCLMPRPIPPNLSIPPQECVAIETAHRERICHAEQTALQEEVCSLRRQQIVADHRLTLLRQQAWGFRLTTPELPPVPPARPLLRTQPVPPVERRRSPPAAPRREPPIRRDVPPRTVNAAYASAAASRINATRNPSHTDRR